MLGIRNSRTECGAGKGVRLELWNEGGQAVTGTPAGRRTGAERPCDQQTDRQLVKR